jgi:NCS1 family nucleobase:cation symporter-1
MGAAVAKTLNRPLEDLDSGQVAFGALGAAGAIAVVIAGWTTSNPTLYRAGLALQVVTPGWPRWLVTLIAGVITTAIACFPFVFRHLLEFVGIYGLLLMPVGAIVVAEHWVFPRIGFARGWSSRKGQLVNWPALAAWGLALTGAAWCWQTEVLHLFFLAVPVWLVTTVLYILFSGMAGARQLLQEPEVETAHAAEVAPVDAPASQLAFSTAARRIAWYAGGLALFCLATILAFSCCRFAEYIGTETVLFHIRTFGVTFNDYLLGATFVYFVSGMVWMGLRERRDVHGAG